MAKWDTYIKELEDFFKDFDIPTTPIAVNRFATIINPVIFVETNMNIIKHQNGKPKYLPYLQRLLWLKDKFMVNKV